MNRHRKTEDVLEESWSARLKSSHRERLRRRAIERLRVFNHGAETVVFAPKRKRAAKVVIKQIKRPMSVEDFESVFPGRSSARDDFAAEAARIILLQRKAPKRLLVKTYILPRHGMFVQPRVVAHSERGMKRAYAKGRDDRWIEAQFLKHGIEVWDAGNTHNVSYTKAGVPKIYDLGALEFTPTKKEAAEMRRIYERLRK
jgi:hypothetical protein